MENMIEFDGKQFLQLYGYCEDGCIDLIKKIEKLNNDEEARIICDEKLFLKFFNNNHKFNGYRLKKLGTHIVTVNEKMLNRYRKYFNIEEDTPIILICSSEFGIVGVIKC